VHWGPHKKDDESTGTDFPSIYLIEKTIFSADTIDFLDMPAPKITLDQWAALVAVVEAGGYAQASARLHRTQSTITYTIKKLEERLGVRVFELQGRKSVLTPTGQALFRRGKALLDEAARVERAAADLARGLGARDPPGGGHRLSHLAPARVPCRVQPRAPGERIELIESVLGGTEEALTEGRVDLAIGGVVPGGFLGDP